MEKPGDLVQLDAMELRYQTGEKGYQFSSRDMISRWDVTDLSTELTSHFAAEYLHTLQRESPFPIRALQIDGASEFMAKFEEARQKKGIKLFVLPPRSPKLNGYVERLNRTHGEEYYQVYETPLRISEQRAHLKKWQAIYNCLRPRQFLDYKTPLQFLKDSCVADERSPPASLSHMSLTSTIA